MLFSCSTCVCFPVQRWRTLLPWDPIVGSVIGTNMFSVLLCPIGGKDPIIFK